MKTIISFTIRNLKKNRKQTIATILGVVFATMLLMTVGFGFSITREHQRKQISQTTGNYHLKVEGQPVQAIETLKNQPNIKTIHIEATVDSVDYRTSLKRAYNNEEYNLEVHSIDPTSIITLASGAMPTTGLELLLPNNLKSKMKLKLGDQIGTYKLVGYYKYASNIAYHDDSYGQLIGYTKTELNSNDPTTAWICLNEMNQYEDTILEIGTKLGLKSERLSNNGKTEVSFEEITLNSELFQLYGFIKQNADYAVKVIAIIFLLTILSIMCILLIYNAFAISVQERKKTMGILSSLGATPKQLLGSIFFEAFIILIIAFPIGMIVDVCAVEGILLFINNYLKESIIIPYTFAVYPDFMLLSLISLAITIFFSAFSPAMRAFEITPLDAIRGNDDIKLKKKKLKTNKLVETFFGVEGTIALKNQKRNKKKYQITVLSLIAGIVFFITISTVINIIFDQIKIQQIEDNSIHISIQGSDEQLFMNDLIDKFPNADITISKTVGPIVGVTTGMKTIPYKDKLNGNQESVLLLRLKEEEEQQFFEFNQLKPKITVLNQLFQMNSSIKLYNSLESITICSKDEDGLITDHCLPITDFNVTDNVPDSYQNPYTLTLLVPNKDWKLVLNQLQIEDDSLWDIQLSGANPSKVEQYINKEKDHYNLETFYYDNQPYNAILQIKTLKAIHIILYLVLFLISLISLSSMFQTIYTSAQLRRKEFGILKSIGMTDKQLRSMLRLESIFLGIKSIVYGLLLSFGAIYLIFQILELNKIDNKNYNYHPPFPTWYILFCIIFVIALLLIVTHYATKQLKKESIIKSLGRE